MFLFIGTLLNLSESSRTRFDSTLRICFQSLGNIGPAGKGPLTLAGMDQPPLLQELGGDSRIVSGT
jgi:hypothetical protein